MVQLPVYCPQCPESPAVSAITLPGPLVRVQRLDPQTGRQPRAGLEGQVQLPQEGDREVEEAGGAAME